MTGFSNGASMAFRVGIELSDRVAAIAPVAGALWITRTKSRLPVFNALYCRYKRSSESNGWWPTERWPTERTS